MLLNRFTFRLDRPECRISINGEGSKVIPILSRERYQHRITDCTRHGEIPWTLKSPTIDRERIVAENDRLG